MKCLSDSSPHAEKKKYRNPSQRHNPKAKANTTMVQSSNNNLYVDLTGRLMLFIKG